MEPLVPVMIDDGSGIDAPRPDTRFYETALTDGRHPRDFAPRSPDDIYVLYTGGTTGMPKGVLWRQEDIFFAAMGGGGWGASPITRADELSRASQPRRCQPGGDAGGGARSCTATPSGSCGTHS
jgi:acyl-CoA synthetase (AMP-forming)/AMP-acid ligase II